MKNKTKKIIIIVFIIIILLAVGAFFGYRYFKNKKGDTPMNTIEVLDSIKGYDYHLEDRDGELYKDTFFKLKDLLEKSNTIDDKLYAEYLTTLFLVDFYTLENKISKYDVGSLDFLYPEEQEKFQKKAMDTMYKLVLDNATNTRKQELPTVTKVELEKIENTEYKKGAQTLPGYVIHATITYQKDLGYDKKVKLTLTKEETKLYVVNLTSEED